MIYPSVIPQAGFSVWVVSGGNWYWNTVTRCGLASQFEQLEQLHRTYSDKGLCIIGFPCSQFLNQEPESDTTMASVCRRDFGVTFLLAQKTEVNGKNTHPVFACLKKKLPGGIFGSRIKWNFTKFLITSEGKPYRRYAPTVKPSAIEKDILKLLDDQHHSH
jgi:glutathione peroxidase